MEEYLVKRNVLVPVPQGEMQRRGGISWDEITLILKYLKKAYDFFKEYQDNFERGFKKGWRML